MKTKKTVIMGLLASTIIFSTSCKNDITGDQPDLPESLEPIEEVFAIEGAESTNITVNANEKEAYFRIELENIGSNITIDNGFYDSWCIDVLKSIDTNNGQYNGIKLYSTYLVEKWKPVNYLLNVQEELRKQDPDISWLEIQLAIWSFRGNPEFDLNNVDLEDLPGQFRNNGQPTFSYDKTFELIDYVKSNFEDFDYSEKGTKFVVIAEMPVDVQTIITVVENK